MNANSKPAIHLTIENKKKIKTKQDYLAIKTKQHCFVYYQSTSLTKKEGKGKGYSLSNLEKLEFSFKVKAYDKFYA